MDLRNTPRMRVKEPYDTDFGQVTPADHNLIATGTEGQIIWRGRPACGIEARVRHNGKDDQVMGKAFFPFCILASRAVK